MYPFLAYSATECKIWIKMYKFARYIIYTYKDMCYIHKKCLIQNTSITNANVFLRILATISFWHSKCANKFKFFQRKECFLFKHIIKELNVIIKVCVFLYFLHFLRVWDSMLVMRIIKFDALVILHSVIWYLGSIKQFATKRSCFWIWFLRKINLFSSISP